MIEKGDVIQTNFNNINRGRYYIVHQIYMCNADCRLIVTYPYWMDLYMDVDVILEAKKDQFENEGEKKDYVDVMNKLNPHPPAKDRWGYEI